MDKLPGNCCLDKLAVKGMGLSTVAQDQNAMGIELSVASNNTGWIDKFTGESGVSYCILIGICV